MFTQGFYSDICWVVGIAHLSIYKYAQHGVQMSILYLRYDLTDTAGVLEN